MVRGLSLTRRAFMAGALGTCLAPAPAAARGDQVVLIVAANSPVTQLDVVDIRRIFLGIPVARDLYTVRAIRNESDRALQEVFLQNIVSMSTAAYRRRLLTLALEQGRQPPFAYTDLAPLLADLARNPTAVSYAWLSTVSRNPHIRVLRVIWAG
jgi:hypothetical protein